MEEKDKISGLVDLVRENALRDFYLAAFNRIQSLGGPGFHSENSINRQDALDALKEACEELIKS